VLPTSRSTFLKSGWTLITRIRSGKGVLQLAKDSGGPHEIFYNHLKKAAKDKNGNALIETFISSSRTQEDRCRGSHQDVYRTLNRIRSKGDSPTETRNGKGKGGEMCYNCGQPGHFASECPNPASSGKGGDKGKDKGKEPRPSYQYRCLTCQAPDHRYCDCPSLSFKGKSGSSGK